MKIIAAVLLALCGSVSGFNYAMAQQPEDLMPKLVRPAGTVYCRFNTGGVDGARFVKMASQNNPINLRQGPGTSYAILGTIGGGAGRIVARYQNWFEVSGYRDSPYTNGWFHGKYVMVSRMTAQERSCLGVTANFNPR
jgi:SH3-like domain-containing protein